MARPAIARGVVHHPGAHRVALDVAMASEEIGFGIDQAGLETAFPEAAGASMDGVDHPDVTPPDVLHHRADCAGLAWRDEKVYVVRHQDVRVHAAVTRRRGPGQAVEIKTPVGVAEEARAAIDAALDDMQRNAGKLEPWRSGHDRITRGPPICYRKIALTPF